MTHEDRHRYLAAIKGYTVAITKDAEAARSALIREGICAADGRLAEDYGGPARNAPAPAKV